MLINKLKQLSSDKFLRNVGWLGGAELVSRVFRLATTVTLARMFSPYDYGLVSAIYTTFEFANIFTVRAGIGAKIIQADEQDLKVICDTSYWLNWILCGSIFVIQCLAAYPIAQFYRSNQLIWPICALALVYLTFPLYMVQASLLERENRLEIRALCNATQAILCNIIIIIFAILGMGVWSVVWSLILTYPVWIIITSMNTSWQPPKSFTIERWKEIISFGGKLIGVDLLTRLRFNLDYLIIGRFLGLEALGVYFFAFSAGLGISQNVIYTFTAALFPHLCAARENSKRLKKQFFKSLKTFALIVIPVVLIQSSLAPFYVPIVFGQKWVTSIPLLVVLCYSAIPFALSRAISQLLQAMDKSHIDLYWNAIFTVIFAAALLLAVQGGIVWIAASVLTTQAVAIPLFTVWVIRYVFAKKLDL